MNRELLAKLQKRLNIESEIIRTPFRGSPDRTRHGALKSSLVMNPGPKVLSHPLKKSDPLRTLIERFKEPLQGALATL